MAPKKKSKKSAGNPARGFATTSVVSKAKVEAEAEEAESPIVPAVVSSEGAPSDPTATKSTEAKTDDLADLSPEELEARLEESELQQLVEKHASKVKKDAARTVSRLFTDRRLFRGQAEILPVSRWIPEDMLQRLRGDLQENISVNSSTADSAELTSSDALSLRLWALRLCLIDVGFSKETTMETLAHLVSHPPLMERAQSEESRDGLWGLGVSLEWLGISRKEDELPTFEASNQIKNSHRKDLSDLNDIRGSETASSISSISGAATPETQASDKTTVTLPNSPALRPLDPRVQESESEGDQENDDDLNPREQIDRYLDLKTRVFTRRPDLVMDQGPAWKIAKAKVNTTVPVDRKTTRLLRRIRAIESDILFDKEGAQDQWAHKRLQLLQDSAQRKKLGLDDQAQQKPATAKTFPTQNTPSTSDDSDDNVGEFFAGLPQEIEGQTGNAATITTTDGKSITLRDFGKWTGVNPRRVLEETCRSRSPGTKIVYQTVSQASFSVRCVIQIEWSKPQEQEPDETSLPGLITQHNNRIVRIQMDSLSTPDKLQSEAFISVAALFHIFSSSPKEENVYKRLPSIWKDLWDEYAQLRSERLDGIDRNQLKEVRDVMYEHFKAVERMDQKPRSLLNPMASEFSVRDIPTRPFTQKLDAESAMALWYSKSSSPYYQHMLYSRQQLPMWSFRDQLLEAVENNQILIICGETGCGKSTQTPAYILEHELSQGRDCKIYCTEPRRISAISLARRVSEELGERKHDVGTNRSLVGYAIRLESQISSTTRLIYATTGIVMRMLENSDGFEDITHIILDEVHERTIDSDFLLIILRRLMPRRPDLKIILMSATVNADLFSRYLGGAPILNIPGRTFPVEVKYLEDAVEAVGQITNLQTLNTSHSDDYGADDQEDDDSVVLSSAPELSDYSNATKRFLGQFNEFRINFNIIVKLLEAVALQPEYIPYSNAILVFLPGLAEIRKINDMLVGHPVFARGWQIFPLHSTIATEAQEAAFDIPPAGTRKVVLATNIAETGITIPDITCVIDTGKHREMRFDERRQLSRLIECFISKANAKQRRGRAGRVQDGLCFHLFTKARHDNVLADQQTPEMLRLSLQDLSLRVKILKLGGIEEILMQALDAPTSKNVRRAIDSLVEVKALTSGEELTSLGRQLAKLPLDVYLGKLILLSAIFQCLDAGLTIAAILTSKSPFAAGIGSRNQADAARLAFRKGDSDLLTVYNAYSAWRKTCQTNPQSEQTFCRKNFLIPQTLVNIEELKGQLAGILLEANFFQLDQGRQLVNRVSGGPYARKFVDLPVSACVNNANELIVNAIVTWAFYPKLLSREGKGYRNVSTNQTVSLHPASINKASTDPPRYLSYYSIMQSSSKFYNALETSAAEDFAVALVCGEAEFKTYSGIMTIDGNRLRFAMKDWKTMMVFKAMRAGLKDVIAQNLRLPGRGMDEGQKVWFDAWKSIFIRQNEIRKQMVR